MEMAVKCIDESKLVMLWKWHGG